MQPARVWGFVLLLGVAACLPGDRDPPDGDPQGGVVEGPRPSPLHPHEGPGEHQQWRGHHPRGFPSPPEAGATSSCGFGDLVAFEREAVHNWLGVDPSGLSEEELVAALRPVVALGGEDPRVGALFVELDALRLDRTLWPSLPASPALAMALASEAIVRVDGHFVVDCELLEGLGRAPGRTVLELALRVDESHGHPLGSVGVEAQPFERKSLHWEIAGAVDLALGLPRTAGSCSSASGTKGGANGHGGGLGNGHGSGNNRGLGDDHGGGNDHGNGNGSDHGGGNDHGNDHGGGNDHSGGGDGEGDGNDNDNGVSGGDGQGGRGGDGIGGSGGSDDHDGVGGHDGSGEVPGNDCVVSRRDTTVPRGLQLLVAFRGAQRARTIFPGPAWQTAVWRYLPHQQLAFDTLLALLGPGGSGSAVIGPAGGTICAEGEAGGACVGIPPGALAAPTLVRVGLAPEAGPLLTPGLVPVGPAVEIDAGGAALLLPATVRLPFWPDLCRVLLVPFASVSVATHDATTAGWELLPSAPEPSVVGAQVAHFSLFQAVVQAPEDVRVGTRFEEYAIDTAVHADGTLW